MQVWQKFIDECILFTILNSSKAMLSQSKRSAKHWKILSLFDLLHNWGQAGDHARPAQTGTAMNCHSFIFSQFFQQFLHMRYILGDTPIRPLGIVHMAIFSLLKRDGADGNGCILITGSRRVDLSIGGIVEASYFSALDDVAQHRHALQLVFYYHLFELRLRVL